MSATQAGPLETSESPVLPYRGLLLLDWDNCYPNQEPGDASAVASHDIPRLLRHAAAVGGLDRLDVRLYGGWTEGASLSRLASQVLSIVPDFDPFPFTVAGHLVHGAFELAHRLLAAPGTELGGTFRRKDGPQPVRLAEGHARVCASLTECPARMVQRFTKKPGSQCPATHCAAVSREVFKVHEQKMVDTLLTCDMVFASDTDLAYLGVVSADTDFIPSLVFVGRNSQVDAYDTPNHVWTSPYDDYLQSAGVRVRRLSEWRDD